MSDGFDITYAAHTATCTFLLDADGICRRIVMAPGAKRREATKNAARCVGAQYVATLDPTVPGCLVEMPKIGTAMLFARIDEAGRVALVRTGIVTSFETKRADDPDPFRESVGVMTSAPATDDLVTPRVARGRDPHGDPYVDHADRTQRIPSLRSRPSDEDPHLAATDEYESEPQAAPPRTTLPSASPQPRTLHDPKVQLSPVEDPDDPYVEHARRGMLPQRGEDPYARTRQNRASEPVPRSNGQPNGWAHRARVGRRGDG